MSSSANALRELLSAASGKVNSQVNVHLWDGSAVALGEADKPTIDVGIASPEAVRKILLQPSLSTAFELYGRGELYIKDAPPSALLDKIDHVSIMRFFKQYGKMALFQKLTKFVSPIGEKGNRLGFLKAASPFSKERDDKEMVHFHYDVSNDFYALFLDEEMIYSCAYFETGAETIDQAQQAKLDLICRKLRLTKGDRLLDIGCGWGALICHAAEHYGVVATGITLSEEQLAKGERIIWERGLEDRVEIKLLDYKNLEQENTYDKVVQVGMFEHVGVANHELFFKKVHSLLKSRGTYLHHAITRRATPDLSKFDRPTAYQAAITKYIFPGGELDYIGRTISNLERLGFEVHHNETLREHYKLTLQHWSDRLWENREEAINLVGEEKVRHWLLYFAVFIAGFDRNTVSIYQTIATKRKVGPSGLPMTNHFG